MLRCRLIQVSIWLGVNLAAAVLYTATGLALGWL